MNEIRGIRIHMCIYRSYVIVVNHMQTRSMTGFQRPVETDIYRRTDVRILGVRNVIIKHFVTVKLHLYTNAALLSQ